MSIFNSPTLRLFSLIVLLVFSISESLAGAGARLRGQVLDQSGAAVAGAVVHLSSRDGLRWSTITDENGAYSFAQLPAGEYLIEVEARNFNRQVESLRLNSQEDRALNVTLRVAAVAEQVVVTAAGTAQSVDEISKSVSLIDSQQIEHRNELSISESLRLTPGLRVQQLGGPASFTAIKTRGLRNQDTAILIDGLRFRDAASTQGDATSLIEDLLFVNTDRLEVLRGSGSSLYGTNAIGGVINIITDEGGGPTHGQMQIEGGSLGLMRSRAKLAGGLGRDRFRYSAGLAHLNLVNGVDGDDAARNTSGQGFAQYSFTPLITLSGRIFTGDSFLQLNDSPFAAPASNLPAAGPIPAIPLALDQQRLREAGKPFTLGNATFIPALNDPDNSREARFFSGALALTQRLNEAASYRISYQGVATSRAFRDGPGGVRFESPFSNLSRFDGRIDTLNARADLQLGRFNLFSAGYEFEREYYANVTRDENPDPTQRADALTRIRQRSHTIFAQNQLRLLDNRFQLSAAARVQTFALSQPEFVGGAPQYRGVRVGAPPTAYTGDGSVSYFFATTSTKLRAHVGNGYRAPSPFERFGTSFFFGSFSPFGDPRLRPDRSVAFDTGIDQTLAGGRVRASATYFYTQLQEVIVFDLSGFADDPFGRFIGYRNTGGSLARGVELSFTAAPIHTLDLSASYTYTNSDQRAPSVAGFLKTFGISDHMFTLAINQQIARRVNVVFDLFAAGQYAVPFFASGGNRAFIFDGPVKADLGVSYTLPVSGDRHIRFYGKVDNVFDRTYFENGFRAPGAIFVGGLTFRF